MFIAIIEFIGLSVANLLKYVSISNQECKVRPATMNINSNEPLFYPYRILINKYNGNCDDINNPYAKLCIPNVIKNINIKVFNLMSRNNERGHIEWQKTCIFKCRLNA